MTKKKLLILGGTFNDVVIVQKAQSMGIHTIVTDRHTDLNRTPAKRIADEHWTIDWSDVPALEEKCRQEHVDGVFAGFDELRLDNLIILCERLNFPCYINKEKLDVTRDKSKFKRYCREILLSSLPSRVTPRYLQISRWQERPHAASISQRTPLLSCSMANTRLHSA